MNFACEQCGKAYSISDDKVQGRAFKVTCKACGHVLHVKATGAATATGIPAASQAAAPTPAPAETGTWASPKAHAESLPQAPAAAPPVRPPPAAARPAPPAAPPRPPAVAPPPSFLEAQLTPVVPGAEQPPAPGATGTHGSEQVFFSPAPPTSSEPATPGARSGLRSTVLLVAGVAGLVVAVGVAFAVWQARQAAPPPPATVAVPVHPATPPATEAPVPAAPPPPSPTAAPAPARERGAVAGTADLPPEAPLEARGGPARGTTARAGFEAVGKAKPDDVREKIRKKNLTIGKRDKKLLDLLQKKTDAAPSPGAVEKTDLDTGRAPLDEAAVRKVMAANAGGYAACVSKAMKADPTLRVDDRRITLNLTILPSGVVSSAWLGESPLEKTPLGKCVVVTARRMVFPAFQGEEIDVAAPLALAAVH